MTNPTTRVLALLELLQAHNLITGAELARRLGVDGRTVRRYMQTLESLGIPIATEPGRYGGYRLVAGFKLPPLMFTRQETLALCLGLIAARRLGLADALPATASVEAKLERVLPEALKRQVRALGQTAAIDIPVVDGVTDEGRVLLLTEATQAQQRVRFCYQPVTGETTTRELDPYGLAFSEGKWYVSGWCHLRGALRSFRLDRMDNLALLPASFGKPEGFDVIAHLHHSIATLPRATAVEVEILTDRATAEAFLGKKLGQLVEENGRLLLRCQTDNLDWFASRLCGLPVDFKIVYPRALKEAVVRHARRILMLVDA